MLCYPINVGVQDMGKEQKTKKNIKKKALMTAKEKKTAKRIKKTGQSTGSKS